MDAIKFKTGNSTSIPYKTFNNLGIEKTKNNFLNLIKGIYKILMANVIFYSEKCERWLSPQDVTKARTPTLTTPIQPHTVDLSQCNKARKCVKSETLLKK